MDVSTAVEVFERSFASRADWNSGQIADLLASGIAFYEDVPAAGLIASQGDVLRLRNGFCVYDGGPALAVELTRQFVERERDGETDVFSQFRIVRYFIGKAALDDLDEEEILCFDRADAAQFRERMTQLSMLQALKGATRMGTEILWSRF